MQRDEWPTPLRRLGGISALLLCAAGIPTAKAADYRYGYSDYYYPYGVQGIHENSRLRREINQLGDQMQTQRRQLDEQTRLQQEQTRLMRQQRSAQQQVSARQACYYRYNGGLDVCDRLFEMKSEKHAACVDTVSEMNSGCARDIVRPKAKPGG